MSKKDLHNAWTALCRRLRRRIPVPKSGLLPILYEQDARVRDAGIGWLCGSFPGNPDLLQTQFGPAMYHQHKVRITNGMQESVWDARMRRETVETILAFVEALDRSPGQGQKRWYQRVTNHTRARKAVRCLS